MKRINTRQMTEDERHAYEDACAIIGTSARLTPASRRLLFALPPLYMLEWCQRARVNYWTEDTP